MVWLRADKSTWLSMSSVLNQEQEHQTIERELENRASVICQTTLQLSDYNKSHEKRPHIYAQTRFSDT